jgi:3-oxoacyl-[acyl-carrier protein] reductase
MDLGLAGKAVFIAGSSRGIGRAIALAFLREGAAVTISGRDAGSLGELEAAIGGEFGPDRVFACRGDLRDGTFAAEALGRAEKHFDGLDCVVLNVGSGAGVRGARLERSEWDKAYAENLWASVGLAQAALPGLTRASGAMVFISSIVGVESLGAPIPYATAKAALIHYANELARLGASHGVRVNTVAPGNIMFQGSTWDRLTEAEPERWRRYVENEVPLQRFGAPEEVAAAVLFLASERSAFTTGACLVVDGGQTRRP